MVLYDYGFYKYGKGLIRGARSLEASRIVLSAHLNHLLRNGRMVLVMSQLLTSQMARFLDSTLGLPLRILSLLSTTL